jgi:hypothetical protein
MAPDIDVHLSHGVGEVDAKRRVRVRLQTRTDRRRTLTRVASLPDLSREAGEVKDVAIP